MNLMMMNNKKHSVVLTITLSTVIFISLAFASPSAWANVPAQTIPTMPPPTVETPTEIPTTSPTSRPSSTPKASEMPTQPPEEPKTSATSPDTAQATITATNFSQLAATLTHTDQVTVTPGGIITFTEDPIKTITLSPNSPINTEKANQHPTPTKTLETIVNIPTRTYAPEPSFNSVSTTDKETMTAVSIIGVVLAGVATLLIIRKTRELSNRPPDKPKS